MRPARAGAFVIQRPFPEKADVFDRCPWSTVFTDPIVGRALAAHGIASRDWGRLFPIPGRPDPRLMEALAVISSEHDRIDMERLQKPPEKR